MRTENSSLKLVASSTRVRSLPDSIDFSSSFLAASCVLRCLSQYLPQASRPWLCLFRKRPAVFSTKPVWNSTITRTIISSRNSSDPQMPPDQLDFMMPGGEERIFLTRGDVLILVYVRLEYLFYVCFRHCTDRFIDQFTVLKK